MKDKLTKLLKDVAGLTELVEKAKENSVIDELIESVNEIVAEKAAGFSEGELEVIGKLVEGNVEVKLEESFSQYSDFGTTLFGDWNESAARTAAVLYKENGGEIMIQSDRVLKFNELYDLEEDHELYDVETQMTETEQSELSQDDCLMLGKRVPTRNLSERLASIRLLQTSEGRREGDWGLRECYVLNDITGIMVLTRESGAEGLAVITSDTQYDEVRSIFESYGKEIDRDLFETLQSALTMPIPELLEAKIEFEPDTVSDKELADLYMDKEYTANEFFAPLVGLIRKHKITKEEFDAASSAYRVFGVSTLEKLLEKAWTPEEEVVDETVDSVSNPTESTPATDPEVKPLQILELFKKSK